MIFSLVLARFFLLAETLDIDALLNVSAIFGYSNILLGALIPIVLLSLGFALAQFVVKFVMRIFNNLGG